ncbi:sugar phosphate isomerase/epimerase [Neobacillus niacini]|uniref:sugar phosphate isomerase/epimerase family protein n=1 Tax=Neobacillus niacini TaxID=86668 RepID=UPI002FFFCF89
MSIIGLQLFSVQKDAEKDFLGTVQKVADLGYGAIQFAGFFQTPAQEVKRVMDSNGMKTAGAHVGITQLLGDELLKTFDYHHILENNLLICPGLPIEMRLSEDDYKKAAETLNHIGETCKSSGFLFGYHNHDFEFDRFANKTGFDLLFENTNPEHVKVELDCFWAAFANQDPFVIIEKYKDRVVSLHMKDLKIVNGKKMGTEIGNGQIDFETLIKIGNEFNIEWFTVEQEEFQRDPYESLAINVNNLNNIINKRTVK